MEKKIKHSHRKHKNQVHLSPATQKSDVLPVLKLLPATILALAFALSLQDREVLAYMISRSMKTKNPICNGSSSSKNVHKSPNFKCGCFNCYSSFWLKWDSSPDKDVILQAIEAFEKHMDLKNQEIFSDKKKKEITDSFAAEKKTKLAGNYVEKSEPLEQLRLEKVAENRVCFPACSEKGIVGKILPDVSDFFNPRLRCLWNMYAH